MKTTQQHFPTFTQVSRKIKMNNIGAFAQQITAIGLFVIIMFSYAFGQDGEIKGVIKDKATGEPVFNVAGYVEVGGVMKGAVTDPDGKYTIKPVSSGVYNVTAKSTGYGTVLTKEVKVTSDKITYVDVAIEQTATLLDDFVITEVLHKIPLISKDEPHVQALTPDEIANSPNIKEPIKMITMLPGLKLGNNGKDVYIRGARPTATQFITDGMKSINGEVGIPGLAIGSVKVYTGGIPAKYGDVTGGVIVVETKSYFDLAQQFK